MTDWDRFEPYGWFAERHHWDPPTVDALPLWTLVRYRRYAAEADRARRGG